MKCFLSHIRAAGIAGVCLLLNFAPLLTAQESNPRPGSKDAVPYESQITNTNLSVAQRVEAARQWMAASDQLPTVQTVLAQITPLSLPAVADGLLNTLSASRLPDTAGAILNHLTNCTPAVRRAAVRVVLRRPEWIRAMLDAMEQGRLARTEIPPEFWRQLSRHTAWT